MKAPARLGLYGLILVVVFAVAGFAANALVPASFVERWVAEAPKGHGEHDGSGETTPGDDAEEGHDDHETDAGASGGDSYGLAIAENGYQITQVSAPESTDEEGSLSFAIAGADGQPVTDFSESHEEEMHLITVRSDGQNFRHVHPEMDADGTWSIPWEWDAAGTYRIFADFVPSETEEGLTLSSEVQVAGNFTPVGIEAEVTEAHVGDFHVTVEGDLTAGGSSELTMVVTRDGEPVTELQPYLGAFGHLVALRHGDLAYLHVHPHGDEPQPGDTSGPEIVFEASAPTPGYYLLYLDFKVDGETYSAPFVLFAGEDEAVASPSPETDNGHEEDEDDHDH